MITLSVLTVLVAASFTTAYAQNAPYQTNQNLTPPTYSGYNVAFPNSYPLSFEDWQFLDNTDLLPPNPPVTRLDGGLSWNNLETARGTYSSTWTNLVFTWTGACSSLIGGNSGWMPTADCNNANASITEGGHTEAAGNTLYTFSGTPGWASSGGGSGWPVSAVSVTGCTTGTCTVALTIDATGFTLNATSPIYDVIAIANGGTLDNGFSLNTGGSSLTAVSGSGAATVITFTLPEIYYSGNTQETRVNYSTTGANLADVTYGLNYPPSDVYGTATCTGTVYNPTVTGDCYFREFVTQLMMKDCDVSSVPASPLTGACAIHYFEGWNEFNTDGSWNGGDYGKLATMMYDADDIIHQFCGDCFFLAGSVSAIDGYHQYEGTYPQDLSAVYSQAIGQLMHDWHYQQSTARHSGVGYNLVPDALSFHPYPSRNEPYYPMPETNVSSSSSDAGCSSPNEPIGYQLTGFTEPSHLYCRDSVISAVNVMGNPTHGILASEPSGFNFNTSTPVWNTESGIGEFFPSNHGATLASSTYLDGNDKTLTAELDQAYVTRQAILLAASGDALNLWYQVDNTTWGPMEYMPAASWWKSTAYTVGKYIWDGKSIQECTTAGTSGTSTPSFNQTLGGTTTDGTVTWTKESTNWAASNQYGVGAVIWDGSHVQEASVGGKSGTSAPAWNATQGGNTTDNTVTWVDVIASSPTRTVVPVVTPMGRDFSILYGWFNGVTFSGTSSSYSTWTASHAYAVNDTIYDGTFGLQRVVTAGTSGTSQPTWGMGMYGTTTDGGVTWELMGTPKCYDTSTFSGGVIQNAPWVCPINEPSGKVGEFVWYTPQDSSHSYTTPAGTTCEWTLEQNKIAVSGNSSVTVYNRPLLFDNRTPCP